MEKTCKAAEYLPNVSATDYQTPNSNRCTIILRSLIPPFTILNQSFKYKYIDQLKLHKINCF